MKGPNPAPLPPPLYSHYSVDRRTVAHPDIPDRRTMPQSNLSDRRPMPQPDLRDRRPMPQPDLLDRRPMPQPDLLDRRPMPQPDLLDRRPMPQPDLLDRRPIPQPDLLDRRPMPQPNLLDWRPMPQPDLLDRRLMSQPDLLDRCALPTPDHLDRRTLAQQEMIDRRMIAPPDGLERRTIALSDGSIRTYFALPPDPPPFARAYHVLDQLPQPMSVSQPQPNLALTPNQGGSGRAVTSEREHERSSQRQSTPNNSKSDRDSDRSGAGPSALKRKHEQEEARSSKREKTGSRDKEKEKEKDKGEKGKTSLEVDKKALLDAFLKMSKVVNESTSQKRNYLSEGRNGPLRCIVCGSYERESKDFVHVTALLMHAYNAMNPELLVKHRALHKALCVLMGWDPSVEPTNSKGYQKLSPDQAQANRDDLVLWPPMVVIQNTNSSSKKDGRLEGIGNKEMDAKLLDLGFKWGKSKSLYGREGHQGVTLVRFSETLGGLKEAEHLSQLFEKTGQGRKNWIEVQKAKENNSSGDKAVNTSDINPNLTKEYGSGEKRVLYGYLATASDLEIFDSDAKKRAVVRSRKESDFPDK